MVNSIKASTIVRTIVLALALINQILTSTGHTPIPIDDDTIYTLVSTIITIVVAVWTWWKNNSFSMAAREADVFLKNLRDDLKIAADGQYRSDVDRSDDAEVHEEETE